MESSGYLSAPPAARREPLTTSREARRRVTLPAGVGLFPPAAQMNMKPRCGSRGKGGSPGVMWRK
jgi:hypothetical protein